MRNKHENLNNNQQWKDITDAGESAFESLYLSLYQNLFLTGYRISGDKELTKDAIQELFLEIWNKRAQLPDIQNVNAYFQTSLQRKIIYKIKQQRKKNHQPLDNTVHEIPVPSYENLLIAAQDDVAEKEQFQDALKSLSPQQFEMLKLRFYKEMSYQKIAEETGKSKQTIYNQIFAAVKKLRKKMIA